MKKIILILAMFLMLLSTTSGIVCVTVGNDQTWNDAQLKIGEKAYFTLVVYNNSADGRFCDTSKYGIVLSVEEDVELNDILDYEIDKPEFTINNQGYERVLITITPKVEGYYEVRATATIMPEDTGGTKLMYGASAKIKAHFSTTGEEKFAEVPFWTIRKDCPNGVVVKQGEECPREVCEDGSFAYGDDYCPEDEPAVGFLSMFSFGDVFGGIDGEILTGIAAIIAAVGVSGGIIYFGFVRKPKPQENEIYDYDQRYN